VVLAAKTASGRELGWASAIADNSAAITICARIPAADLLQMQQARRHASIEGCTPFRARRCRFDSNGARA